MSSRSKSFRSTSLWLALLVSGGGLAIAGTALAQEWGTYEKAFPATPCHDGWAACIVDGERVTPDMTAKGPADMRVGWFDLEPSTAFSPFTGLTEYTGEVAVAAAEEPAVADAGDGGAIEPDEAEDDGVASAPSAESVEANRKADEAAMEQEAARAAEEEARRQAEEDAAAAREAEAAAAAATREQEKRRKEAERMAKEAEKAAAAAAAAADAEAKAAAAAEAERIRKEAEAAKKAADEAERKRQEAERQEAERRAAEEAAQKKAAEEERKRQEAEAAAKAAEEEARQKAEEDRKRREAEEAERKAEADRLAAEKAAADAKAAEEAAAAAAAAGEDGGDGDDGAAAVETAPPPAMDDGSCDNLQAMEPPAMLGKMSDGQVSCLEGKLAASMKMTEKKKISLLLMTNAFSGGDKAKWEELVKRHLDEIDQSDPDLCYKYALYLAGKGPSRASGVIRWANVALENRTVWTGDTYKSRVNSLFKMRAAASQKLWQSAEKEHAASPSEATSSKIEKYRNMTKVNAREWYEYAKVSGKDTTKPLQLCMSAAGTSDYCDGG